MIQIVEDDLSGTDIAALLEYHLTEMNLHSPPGHVFAFDLDRLRAPDVRFWAAREKGKLLGCAALKELDMNRGEVKSMRTAPGETGRDVGTAMLRQIIGVAEHRGYRQLSLETGSGNLFEPALRLYRRHGFVSGDVFGTYMPSAFNQFLHLDLR